MEYLYLYVYIYMYEKNDIYIYILYGWDTCVSPLPPYSESARRLFTNVCLLLFNHSAVQTMEVKDYQPPLDSPSGGSSEWRRAGALQLPEETYGVRLRVCWDSQRGRVRFPIQPEWRALRARPVLEPAARLDRAAPRQRLQLCSRCCEGGRGRRGGTDGLL